MASDDDRPWLVPIPPGFRACGLSSTAQSVLIALCAHARRKCFCWVSNATLAEDTRLAGDTVRAALRELELAGWVVRELAECKRVRRVGVILLKRPDYPVNGGVAEGESGIIAAREGLRRDRATWQAKQRPNRFRRAAGVYQPAK